MSEAGDLLRALREEKGLSLNKLAVEANYNKGQLSKIENGQRPLPEHIARHLDRILETDGQLFRAITPRKEAVERPSADAADPWPLAIDGTGGLRLGAGPFAVTRILPNSWIPEDMAGQFEAQFQSFRSMGHCSSPAFVIPYLAMAFQQVTAVHSESAVPELVRTAYRIAEYTGWMCQEAGVLDHARAWTDIAVGLATRVGDVALRGYALVRGAEMAVYDEDPYSVIDLARRADADPGAPAAVRSLAAQREADGHAMLGDMTACLRALDAAQRWHDEAARDAGPHYGTTSLADPIATSRGWSMLHFDLDESAELLSAAIDRMPPASVRSRVRFSVRLARVLALREDIDGACALLTSLLEDIRRTDSATVRVDLKRLTDSFAKHRAHSGVRDLRPEISALLRLRH